MLEAVFRAEGRVTLAGLGDLMRGLGGGSFSSANGKSKATVDLAAVAGGKVTMNKEVSRALLRLVKDG